MELKVLLKKSFNLISDILYNVIFYSKKKKLQSLLDNVLLYKIVCYKTHRDRKIYCTFLIEFDIYSPFKNLRKINDIKYSDTEYMEFSIRGFTLNYQ